MCSARSACIRANWFYWGKSGSSWTKVVVFRLNGYIRARVVVFGQSGCIRAKVVVFRKAVILGKKWLYSFKGFLFGQNGCIRAKWVYLGKVVVFGQKCL